MPRWRPHGILGVVHLPPLPGDPAHREASYETILDAAKADAEALVAGGVDGIIVENFGSAPFYKGTPQDPNPPHVVAFMTRVVQQLRADAGALIGVNCLRNDARAALGIAAATGAECVRVNVHVGAYVTDQGIIEGAAADTLRYRQAIGAHGVALLADVLVKHATPLAPLPVEVAVRDTFDRGLADAVVVTGSGTGAPVSVDLLRQVRDVAGRRPVLIGSGLTPDNAGALAPLADGAIVGTYFKRDGHVHAPVDAQRVRRLCEEARASLR